MFGKAPNTGHIKHKITLTWPSINNVSRTRDPSLFISLQFVNFMQISFSPEIIDTKRHRATRFHSVSKVLDLD